MKTALTDEIQWKGAQHEKVIPCMREIIRAVMQVDLLYSLSSLIGIFTPKNTRYSGSINKSCNKTTTLDAKNGNDPVFRHARYRAR